MKFLKIIIANILCLSFCTTVFGETPDERYDNVINTIAPYIGDENKDEEISRRDCIVSIMKLMGVDQKIAFDAENYWLVELMFMDLDDMAEYSKGYIVIAKVNHITNGYDRYGSMFYPDRSVTIKECLTFMLRCIKNWRSVEWDKIIPDSIEAGLLTEEESQEFSDDTLLTEQFLYTLLFRMLNQNRYRYYISNISDYLEYDESGSMTYIDWWYEQNIQTEDVG